MGRRERERERDREREREEKETRAENSDKLQCSIFVPSFQLKVPRSNGVQIAPPSSSRANMLIFLNKNMK